MFVVGNAGVEYFDGKNWTDVDLGGCFAVASVPPLHRVSVIGDREAFVTSNAGVVVHLTSAGCTKLPNVPGDPNLGEVWASSPTDVYAIESQNVWHYNGSSWTSALQGFYVGVMGTGPNDVYVAHGSIAQILHYTGTWQVPLAVPNMNILNAFWRTGSDLRPRAEHVERRVYRPLRRRRVESVVRRQRPDRPGSTMVVYGAGSGATSVATGFYYNLFLPPCLPATAQDVN